MLKFNAVFFLLALTLPLTNCNFSTENQNSEEQENSTLDDSLEQEFKLETDKSSLPQGEDLETFELYNQFLSQFPVIDLPYEYNVDLITPENFIRISMIDEEYCIGLFQTNGKFRAMLTLLSSDTGTNKTFALRTFSLLGKSIDRTIAGNEEIKNIKIEKDLTVNCWDKINFKIEEDGQITITKGEELLNQDLLKEKLY